TRMVRFAPSEQKVDLQILDDDGNCLVEVQGLVAQPTGHRPKGLDDALYEYQWKLAPRQCPRAPRDSNHLLAFALLSPILQKEGQILWRRFDRARFQDQFRIRSQSLVTAYLVSALRALGWAPEDVRLPVEKLAGRLGIIQQHWRWGDVMLKSSSPHEVSAAGDPRCIWKALWSEFPECLSELQYLRLCGENLAAVLRGEVDPLNLIFPEGALNNAQTFYQDSVTARVNNLLVQKVVGEI